MLIVELPAAQAVEKEVFLPYKKPYKIGTYLIDDVSETDYNHQIHLENFYGQNGIIYTYKRKIQNHFIEVCFFTRYTVIFHLLS